MRPRRRRRPTATTATSTPATTPGPRRPQRHDRLGRRHGARVEVRHAARRRPALDGARRRAAARRRPRVREPRGDALGRSPSRSAAARRTASRSRHRLRCAKLMTGGGLRHHEPREQPRRRLRHGRRALDRDALCARPGVRWTGRPGQITILRRNGLRIAFLGFAPYNWASRLEQIARRAGARAQGRLAGRPRRRRDARGRRGLGRHARPARHRDVPGREPRRLAPLRARRHRRRRRPRGRLGTARDPRHGALSRAPDRLLARQLRGLQELRHRRHALAERDPERAAARRRRVRRRYVDRRCASTATRCRTRTPRTPARASSRSCRARTSALQPRAVAPDGAIKL